MTFDKVSYEKGYNDGHAKGYERGQLVPRDEERRAEALRAAAAVSGAIMHEATEQYGEPPNTTQAEDYTLRVAKRFARWLEMGEAQP